MKTNAYSTSRACVHDSCDELAAIGYLLQDAVVWTLFNHYWPVPVTFNVSTTGVDASVTVIAAARVPTALGVKVTVKVQCALGALRFCFPGMARSLVPTLVSQACFSGNN